MNARQAIDTSAPATACALCLCTSVALGLVSGTNECAIEEGKVIGSDVELADFFGEAVSIDGDVAVVGAPFHDTDFFETGAAYVFRDQGNGTWIEEMKLEASDIVNPRDFGDSVSVSGDVIAVGCPDDNSGSGAGTVYIFRHAGGGIWNEEAVLSPSDGANGDLFGFRVSLTGDVLAISAPFDDDLGGESGSAYVFRHLGGGTWNEEDKLVASDGAASDQFGSDIALSDDAILVGSFEDDDTADGTGSAYLYRHDGNGNWIEEDKLVASDAEEFDQFGLSVDLDGDVALIGARFEDAAGVNSGSAYIFRHDGLGNWNQEDKLIADDGDDFDNAGFCVSLSGDTALVSSDFDGDNGNDSGSAYLFRDDGAGNWNQLDKILPSDGEAFERFGYSLQIRDGRAIIGAFLDDDGAGGGSAYLFDVNCLGSCPADIASAGGETPDGTVDVSDLLALLANWGTNGAGADLAAPTDVVDVSDLLELLASWGDC